MKNSIVIYNFPRKHEWKKIFLYILSVCDGFRVKFPDGEYDPENPLMGGKLEFENLKGMKKGKVR